jgi:uncharacterized membrane protein YozB (DUF420 family)
LFTAGNVILLLKVAVTAVTVLLVLSLLSLWRGRPRWHGRINLVVFVLTLSALLGLEVLARIISPKMFNEYFDETGAWGALYIHLAFSLPAAAILLVMLVTGLRRNIRVHYPLGLVFLVLWAGTFITGVFFLPH